MKCILPLVIVLLAFDVAYSQGPPPPYNSPETWNGQNYTEGAPGGGTTNVNTQITRINGTQYTHTNQHFVISDQNTGWLTQFNDFTSFGQIGTNIDYFNYQGTNYIETSNSLSGDPATITGGNIVFDEVYFNIGAGNTMNILNILRPYTTGTYFNNPPGGITVAKTLHFENGITTTNRDYPVRGAIVFVNSASYTNTGGNPPSDAQHVDGYVTEYNHPNNSTGAAGHGGTFTFPVGNSTSVYPLQRSGTYTDIGYLLSVGWVDGDPNATIDQTDNDPTTFPPGQGTINFTDLPHLTGGIVSVIPAGFWDWHYQVETDIDYEAIAMTNDQTITVSIPDLLIYGGITAADLRLVGWDAGIGKWINLSVATPGATGLTKGSTLIGKIDGGTNITALAIGSMSAVLPVTFGDFTVKIDGCKAKLQWETSFEQNNSHFIVERSTDGTQFFSIGQVAAAGNSTTTQTYNYTDNAPAAGANYYRITQVDFDGKYSSSPVVLVQMKCEASTAVKIYPNPVSSRLYIQSAKTVMQVNILNSGGQPVMKYVPSVNTGGIFDINVQKLPSGIYMLQMINKDGTIDVNKLMKE